jgi:hypothetical protein
MTDNVIEFPRKNGLFTVKQRERLASRITHVAGPALAPQVIDAVEQELCIQIVEQVRESASCLGARLGKLLGERFFS